MLFSIESTDEEPLLSAGKDVLRYVLKRLLLHFGAKLGSESCHSDQIWLWEAISEAFFFAYCKAFF